MLKNNIDLELDEQPPFSVDEYLKDVPTLFRYIINNNISKAGKLIQSGWSNAFKWNGKTAIEMCNQLERHKIMFLLLQSQEECYD